MSHNTEAAGETQTDRMSYTRRTVLTNGLTNVVVDLPEKEIERLQTGMYDVVGTAALLTATAVLLLTMVTRGVS